MYDIICVAVRVLMGHSTTLKLVRIVIHQQTPPPGISPCCPDGHDQTFDKLQNEGMLYKLAYTQVPASIVHLTW